MVVGDLASEGAADSALEDLKCEDERVLSQRSGYC
jgi:hypothetical protein